MAKKTSNKKPLAVPAKIPMMDKAFPVGKKKSNGKSKGKGC